MMWKWMMRFANVMSTPRTVTLVWALVLLLAVASSPEPFFSEGGWGCSYCSPFGGNQ